MACSRGTTRAAIGGSNALSTREIDPEKWGSIVSATIDPTNVFASHQHDFEAVISRYSPVLLRVALRRLGNMEDAEDAVQDALLSAHRHIRQFEGRSQLSTWLTTIVTNAALMKIRGRSRHEMLSLDQDRENDASAFANEIIELKDTRPNPETLYTQAEMNEVLRRALAQLSPKLRSAIQLCELEGYSLREAARILGISGNALKSRVSRARANLSVQISNGTSFGRASASCQPKRPLAPPESFCSGKAGQLTCFQLLKAVVCK